MNSNPACSLNSNQLKLIAIVAMTIDHISWALFPDFPKEWWIIALHIIGRITAPIMWFFIAEGYHYTRNVKKYLLRLFTFAIISHFAYNFAGGIPFVPFKTSVFNQTSVIWTLVWGVVALCIIDSKTIKNGFKPVLITIICLISFCADWSCIAVMAIISIHCNRGDFKKQMIYSNLWVVVYAVVYFIFIDKVYGIIQIFTVLSIPFLKAYNGERGKLKSMKWFFYIYYPLHLVLCGIIRLKSN